MIIRIYLNLYRYFSSIAGSCDVKILGPSLVITIVCSYWHERPPSAVRAVQPFGSSITARHVPVLIKLKLVTESETSELQFNIIRKTKMVMAMCGNLSVTELDRRCTNRQMFRIMAKPVRECVFVKE